MLEHMISHHEDQQLVLLNCNGALYLQPLSVYRENPVMFLKKPPLDEVDDGLDVSGHEDDLQRYRVYEEHLGLHMPGNLFDATSNSQSWTGSYDRQFALGNSLFGRIEHANITFQGSDETPSHETPVMGTLSNSLRGLDSLLLNTNDKDVVDVAPLYTSADFGFPVDMEVETGEKKETWIHRHQLLI